MIARTREEVRLGELNSKMLHDWEQVQQSPILEKGTGGHSVTSSGLALRGDVRRIRQSLPYHHPLARKSDVGNDNDWWISPGPDLSIFCLLRTRICFDQIRCHQRNPKSINIQHEY